LNLPLVGKYPLIIGELPEHIEAITDLVHCLPALFHARTHAGVDAVPKCIADSAILRANIARKIRLVAAPFIETLWGPRTYPT
jgi:hypothetical protein